MPPRQAIKKYTLAQLIELHLDNVHSTERNTENELEIRFGTKSSKDIKDIKSIKSISKIDLYMSDIEGFDYKVLKTLYTDYISIKK